MLPFTTILPTWLKIWITVCITCRDLILFYILLFMYQVTAHFFFYAISYIGNLLWGRGRGGGVAAKQTLASTFLDSPIDKSCSNPKHLFSQIYITCVQVLMVLRLLWMHQQVNIQLCNLKWVNIFKCFFFASTIPTNSLTLSGSIPDLD